MDNSLDHPDQPNVNVEEILDHARQDDIFQEPGEDPWRRTVDAATSQSSSSGATGPPRELRRGMDTSAGRVPHYTPAFAQVTLPAQDQGVSQRIIHDVPPVWDGKDPDNMAEPYLKLLTGWLSTTRTLKTQRGMTILHYSHGDLKLIINELDVTTLTSEDSGNIVFKHVKNAYAEYLVKKLPQPIERALYDPAGHRSKGESMLQFISRKKTLLKRLIAPCLHPLKVTSSYETPSFLTKPGTQ